MEDLEHQGESVKQVTGEKEEEQLRSSESVEDQDEDNNWDTWQRKGSRFRCQTCGNTRNTKSQILKHIKEHEDLDDASFTCDKCPYQTNSRDQLINHIETTHKTRDETNSSEFKCNKCVSNFKTKRELTNHIKETHKSHKPCDYFIEDRCELDDDCRFRHIKLLPGDHICYTCGKIFKSKSEMINHIKEKHGNTICHKYLRNECTVRRCFYRHDIQNAPNLERTQETSFTTAQDFPSLPTTRPVVSSQVSAQNPHPQEIQATQQTIEALTKQMSSMLNQMNLILSMLNKTNN